MRSLLFILILSLFSCSPKIRKLPEYPFDVVRVTRGGGFTGNVTGFAIDRNGEINNVYQLLGKSARQTFLRQTSQDSIHLVFDKVLASGIHKTKYQVPGNMTYSIILQKDSIVHTVSWSDADVGTENYKELYRYLRDFASGKMSSK